jgi:hypothetical protein
MAFEYDVWFFAANAVAGDDFSSSTFKQESANIRGRLTELGKQGWKVVSQSTFCDISGESYASEDMAGQLGKINTTNFRLVYTLMREV